MPPTDERAEFQVSRHRRLENGVLVVFLLAVSILGALSLIVQLDPRRQLRTMEEMRVIAAAVEAYRAEQGSYPRDLDGTVAALRSSLEPTHVDELPTTDAWGGLFLYSEGLGSYHDVQGRLVSHDSYTIGSRGKDGVRNGPARGPLDRTEHDLVFSDGSFVTYSSQNRPY